MKIFEFKTEELNQDGRSYIIAIPIDKIDKIESIVGGENVYLKVNSIEVKGSYRDLIKELESYKD
jgi:hypothetical protein